MSDTPSEMPNDRSGSSEPRELLWTTVSLVAAFLSLRYVLPWVAVWIGASPNPAPTPAFAMAMYMACAVIGALVYLSASGERWRRFLGPIVRLLAVPPRDRDRLRIGLFILLPVAVGWLTWQRISPRPETPAALRVQHPTLPRAYAELENPLSELPEDARRDAERDGVVLYQKNCRPCHGTKATGDGPLARGLRLRPVDFTDPGTIATVVEAYPFWRIEQGAPGLPGIATPWHSAMPPWEDELDDEEIWRIIQAEYAIAGREPRRPEGSER